MFYSINNIKKVREAFNKVSGLFFSVSAQWQLKPKTITKLYCHYCTSLTIVSFMMSRCGVIII